MNVIKLENWKMFTEIIENITPDFPNPIDNTIQYRGQSNKDWKLTPTLTRIVNGDVKSEEKAYGYENQSQMDFFAQAHLLDSKLKYDRIIDPSSMLIDMQHYSCPTRLLDWSQSPYVALYFAVNDSFDLDGALFIWDWRFYKKNYKVIFPEQNEIPSTQIFNFSKNDILELIHPVKMNERIVRQQGLFSVSNNILRNHDDLIISYAQKANMSSGLHKLLIPAKLKFDFLARLKTMNISSESLFPGLDGLGKTIKESLLLRKWKNI